ncbi:MAG: hypothetical protein FJZ58_00665 [Chlamydiae bacterium]|nr:hypothetical protein [Chlamydiota bacterium]
MRPPFHYVCALSLSSVYLFSQDTPPITYLSSSRPSVEHGWGLFLSADWLYWKASETGLGYTLSQEGFDEKSPEFMGFGDIVEPKFSWDSGFRVGLGYNIPRDQWTLETTWIWYEGKADGSAKASREPGSILFPSFIHPNLYNDENIFSAISADSDLLLHVNIIDLFLGRTSSLGQYVSFRPHLGLRNAWIYQTYDVNYGDLSFYDEDLHALEPALEGYSVRMINNFWGLGPRMGMDVDFSFGGGWSLFGNFAASLLYGTFNLSHTENFQTLDQGEEEGMEGVLLSEKSDFHAGRFITDIQLGMRWSSSFRKERVRLLFQAGWEHHMFFSQNQMLRFVDGQNFGNFVQNQGDLYLQGWTLSFSFYF